MNDPTWTLKECMEHYGVPAVSIAVIHDGKVAWSRTDGLADRVEGKPAVPTVVQVLDGSDPANTGPVRVDFVPGSEWRYSGAATPSPSCP